MSIEGKVQVVPGGTSGMGLAVAKELGQYGPVVIAGRNEKRLADALETLAAAGVEAYGKTCDIGERESVRELVEYATSLGEIGAVVNAAGVDWGAVPDDVLIQINMLGTAYVTEEFLPHMDGSVMMHFSSVTGYLYQPAPEDIAVWNEPDDSDFVEKWTRVVESRDYPFPEALGDSFAFYAGSKRFVMYYTMANAMRFGRRDSRILSIAPGSFDTPMLRGGVGYSESTKQGTAFGRFGTPEEMAVLVAQLVGPGHDYLTGVDILHDGGKLALQMAKQLD